MPADSNGICRYDPLHYFYLDVDAIDVSFYFGHVRVPLGPVKAGKHVYFTRHQVELPTNFIYWCGVTVRVSVESGTPQPTMTYVQRMYLLEESDRIKQSYERNMLIPIADGVIIVSDMTVEMYKKFTETDLESLPNMLRSTFLE